MSLSKKMEDALNGQIKHEIYSAYLYLAMSQYCEAHNLPGTAHWLHLQWEEELEHAQRFMKHINQRGGRVVLAGIDKPPAEFGTLSELFKAVLKHEQSITAKIHKLYELAAATKDYAAQTELQWFIKEQVEEEENATLILEQLRLVGDHLPALFMLDRELGKREG